MRTPNRHNNNHNGGSSIAKIMEAIRGGAYALFKEQEEGNQVELDVNQGNLAGMSLIIDVLVIVLFNTYTCYSIIQY